MPAPEPDAIAALPLEIEPAALDYSRGDTASLEPARQAFIVMTWLAVLSGLCVASCFLVLYTKVFPPAVALHLLIYAATLSLAVWGGKLLARYNAPSLRSAVLPVLDSVAGVGLLMLAVAPFLVDMRSGPQEFTVGFLGVAFLFLCLTTPRHLILYRGLAGLVTDTGRHRMGRWLHVLGWLKFAYEGLWLFCCSAPLLILTQAGGPNGRGDLEGVAVWLGLGALFGAMGFTVVWVMMMITHGRLAALTQPRATYHYTGPDVDTRAAVPDVWAIEAQQRL